MDSKKSRLGNMRMPIAAQKAQEAGLEFPEDLDPETGLPSSEESLEEGDLILDYVMPIRNMFTGGIKAIASAAAKAGAKEATRLPLKDRIVAPIQVVDKKDNVLDYKAMRPEAPKPSKYGYRYSGQQGPGTVTDATTGFDSSPGIKVRD